ncbi:MAG: hypothetical protein ABSB35_03030 [Bryobacteraceae bacterium]|jgi:hypothetical protein
MHRLCVSIAAFSLCLANAAGQSTPSALEFTHPDAKALIGLDIRSLRQSSVAQIFGSDIKQTGVGMFQFPGMEILDDVDQIAVSSPGPEEGGKKENPPFLLIATGHFAPEHVGPLLHGEHQTYNDVKIYPMGDNMGLAMLNPQTIVLGDVPSIKGAIDHRGAKNPNSLVTRGAAMSSSYNVWLIATISPSAFQPGAVSFGRFVQDIRGIDAGISLHEGMDLDVGVLTSTPEAAELIGKLITNGMQTALTSKLDIKEALNVARKVQVSSDGNRIHVKFALTQEELENQIRTMRKAPPTTNLRIAEPTSAPVNRAPQTIRIYGLDDGVREIPVSSR